MKRTLTLLALLWISSTAFSQTRLGFKGGFTLANMRGTASQNGDMDTENGDPIAGFHLGMILDQPAGRNFHIRPELLIVTKGSSFDVDPGVNSKLKFKPYYVEVPVNFVWYKTYPRSGASIFLGGGPALSVGIGGKAEVEGLKTDVFNEGLLKRFDLGLGMIFGVDLPNGLTFNFSTNTGLLNQYDEPRIGNPYNLKMYHSNFNLSIGYLLQ